MSDSSIPNAVPLTNKRRWFIMAASLLFLVGLPVLTVSFSKFGLDKFRDFKKDMRLLKDSIALTPFDVVALRGDSFSSQSVKGRLVILHHYASASDANWAMLAKLQQKFHEKEDRGKVLFFSIPLTPEAQLSAPPVALDTAYWYALPATPSLQQLARLASPQDAALRLTLIDPRGYLCDNYATAEQADYARMVAAMSLLMPKRKRKKYEFRPDTVLYE